MKLCSNGHDEIVYDQRKCPLCEALDEVESLKDERNELKADIDSIVKDAEREANS